MTDPSVRNCYCTIWESDPEFLRAQGIPEGFCGLCDRCGAPGHIRHAPNGMPYTATWCDRCFRIARFTQPLVLWIAVYGFALVLIVSLWLRLRARSG